MTKLKMGHRFHLAHLSVCLWTELCPLCIFHDTSRVYFLSTHLINQLRKVCPMLYYFLISKFEFLPFFKLHAWIHHVLASLDVRLDGLIDIEQKGYEFIWCRIHYMTLAFDPTHDFVLVFSRSNFREWVVWLTSRVPRHSSWTYSSQTFIVQP